MARAIIGAALLAVVLFLGCGSNDRTDVTSRRLSENGAEVQSTSGHVESIGRQGGDNRYSFIATKRFNPETGETTVSGETQYQSISAAGTFVDAHGTVICLEIVGNVARFGAVGDHTFGLPENAPHFGYFTVVDNGEGANDPPDMASNLFGG